LLAGFFFCMAGILVLSAAVLYLSPKLPGVETLRDVKLQVPLRIYSSDNKLIGEFGEKRRSPIRYSDTPELLIKAVLAAEDDEFERHHGVDIKGLLRAASQLLVTGSIQTGGSTITMQVAKNYFLSHERTFLRKFNEILLALQIERELGKNEILELYLNKIYLGKRAYGVEAAAQVYYGKSINELNLAQLAMIAGLPKAPSSYNPLANPERALARRNWILQRMLSLGYINSEVFAATQAEPITASYHGLSFAANAQYAAEMARQFMLERFGDSAYTEGYRVHTTINSEFQAKAQSAVVAGLAAYDKRHGYRGPEAHWELDAEALISDGINRLREIPVIGNLEPALVTEVMDQEIKALLADGTTVTVAWENGLRDARPYKSVNVLGARPQTAHDLFVPGDVIRLKAANSLWHLAQVPEAQAALVSLNPSNGALLAVVGGFDFRQSKFNRVIQAFRQPGSNIKPLLYSAALENGFTAASLINDAPIVFDDSKLENSWRPENSSGRFYGPTSLRTALVNSRNLVSIRLLRKMSVNTAVDYLQRFGLDAGKLPRDLSLALGTHTMTPLEVATAYAVFANGGYRVEPYLVEQVVDTRDEIVYQAENPVVCNRQCALDKSLDKESHTEAESLEALLEEDNNDEIASPSAPRIVEERVAYIIDSFLKDVVRRGTGRKALALDRKDIAGKTGTTNGPTDAWFSGYAGNVVTTTWVGFDNNTKLGNREYGGTAALPIWIDYMRTALRAAPEQVLEQPDGIVSVKIDPSSGKLAAPHADKAVFELFRSEFAPREMHTAPGGVTPYNPDGHPAPETIF
jgi:penicillin-binding protein 1A